MELVLYSTNCPQCHALEAMLKNKHLEPQIVCDASEIMRMGFRTAPILKVDGVAMTFPQAVSWVRLYEPKEEEEFKACASCVLEEAGDADAG